MEQVFLSLGVRLERSVAPRIISDVLLTEEGCELTSVLWFTDKGTVQKVIVLPRDDLQTEELVLEEVEVFKVGFQDFPNIYLVFF